MKKNDVLKILAEVSKHIADMSPAEVYEHATEVNILKYFLPDSFSLKAPDIKFDTNFKFSNKVISNSNINDKIYSVKINNGANTTISILPNNSVLPSLNNGRYNIFAGSNKINDIDLNITVNVIYTEKEINPWKLAA